MPNILQSIIPSFGGKTIFVTTQDGTEVFPSAQFLKAEVRPESRPMEHPVESGAIITDHRILLPTEIELSAVLSTEDYKDVYKQITTLYVNATLLTVQCRAGTFTNQLIQSIPHTEDAEQYDAILITIKLKQVLIATTPSTSMVSPGVNANSASSAVQAPASPTNSNTVQAGLQNANAPTDAQTTAAQAALARNNVPPGLGVRDLINSGNN